MDQDTIGKVADATKAMAETGDTALKVAGKFGSYFDGPLRTIAKMMDRELQFIVAKRGLRLSDKWIALLTARGQALSVTESIVNAFFCHLIESLSSV